MIKVTILEIKTSVVWPTFSWLTVPLDGEPTEESRQNDSFINISDRKLNSLHLLQQMIITDTLLSMLMTKLAPEQS